MSRTLGDLSIVCSKFNCTVELAVLKHMEIQEIKHINVGERGAFKGNFLGSNYQKAFNAVLEGRLMHK